MKRMLGSVWRVCSAESFSPKAFLLWAVVITVLFAGSELLGLREYTSFLSGTNANPDFSWEKSAMLGLIHLALYVAFILLGPIFLITAALLRCLRLARRR